MTTEEHLSKHDREIAEIYAIQKRAEAALRAFIASFRGGNGHRKRNVP